MECLAFRVSQFVTVGMEGQGRKVKHKNPKPFFSSFRGSHLEFTWALKEPSLTI